MADSTSVNKEYFNKEASTYEQKHERTINQLVAEIQARREFIGADWLDEDEDEDEEEDGDHEEGGTRVTEEASKGRRSPAEAKKSVRLLDYACGTGLVSRALIPYCTQCVGIDISEKMVEAYNTRARNQGLSESEMHAVQGDLLEATDPDPAALSGPRFRDFDLAAVGLGLHHFADPAGAAARLARRLRPGGVLVVVDFLPHAPADADADAHGSASAAHTVVSHGFGEEQVRAMFEGAGAGGDFRLEEMGAGVVLQQAGSGSRALGRRVFLARGTKV